MTIDTLRLTPERIIAAIKGTGTPIISPDGSTVAYSLSEVDPTSMRNTSQIWLINADGSEPRQLSTQGLTNSGQVWSASGSSIAWVSKRDGEKPFAIVTLDVQSGLEREVNCHATSPLSLAWSPDETTIAYALLVDPENPTEEPLDPEAAPKVRAFRRLDYKQDNRGLLYDTRLQIFVVDVASGDTRQISQNPLDHTDPQWSPDGSLLAFKVLNRNGMHHQLGILNPQTGDGKLVGTEDWMLGTFRWSRDGSFIFFDGNETHSPQSDYARYDLASGSVTWLTSHLQFAPEVGYPTLGSPSQPVWIGDTIALVHGIQAGASGLWTVDAFTGEISVVARFEAVHTGLSMDDARSTVVQGRSTPLTTGEIVAFDLSSQAETVILSPNSDVLGETPAGSFEKITIERGGELIDSWLMFPPDFDSAGSYPVVLYIHGGPHGNYGYGFDRVAAVLANAGYVVVMPNPRGSGTYGRRFAELVRGDWGYEDWADLEASLDEVLKRPYTDADRTAVMGYSYGGYMTSWAIGHTNRFAAAVCGAPVFDLESFYGTSDIGHVWGIHQWGGELPDHREWLMEHSPSTHIQHATTPTLIIHGEQDHRCPIGQGEQLFVALSRLGVETEFVRYPGGSHLMFHSGPNEHKIDYYQRVIDWFGDRV